LNDLSFTLIHTYRYYIYLSICYIYGHAWTNQVSPRLKRNIQSVEGVVTKYGTGAHIVLPKEWLGKMVRVVPLHVKED